jgi:hypothetical protein
VVCGQSHHPPLYSWKEKRQYPLDRWLGGKSEPAWTLWRSEAFLLLLRAYLRLLSTEPVIPLFYHWLYSTLGICLLTFQFHNHCTDGRTPWTSDQLVARPLPKHRTTQTQNKHIHLPNIHAICRIRTHDPGFRASENSTCLKPLGYRDRQLHQYKTNKQICYYVCDSEITLDESFWIQ